jgi:hypothetical protein
METMKQRLLFELDEEFIAASYSKERTFHLITGNKARTCLIIYLQKCNNLSFRHRQIV